MILIKNIRSYKLLKTMAAKAMRYNNCDYPTMEDELINQLLGMQTAAGVLGVKTSIIWSENNKYIAMVKVNGAIERIEH